MSAAGTLAELLSQRRDEIARLWLEEHLSRLSLRSEVQAVTAAHGRAPALLDALRVAVSGEGSDFSRREAVQAIVMMARSMVESDVTPGSVAAAVTALGRALERVGSSESATALAPLAAALAEALVGSALEQAHRRGQELLAAQMPLLLLPRRTALLAASGEPDEACASEVVARALKLAASGQARSFVLDLSHLGTVDTAPLSTLLELCAEVTALGGTCVVVGVPPHLTDAVAACGLDATHVRRFATVADALRGLWRGGGLRSLARRVLGLDG